MKVFGVVGWKNSGKTGLMERLVSEITGRGFRVSTVKHAHHRVDVDQPGRDSHRHREAGAREVMLSSARRWALMHELRDTDEPSLEALLSKMTPVDLILIEGYKHHDHPKVEAHRAETRNPLIAETDDGVTLIASDVPLTGQSVPVIDLNDTAAIADHVLERTGLARAPEADTPKLVPPRLKNDCFSLPPGVDWTPVDDALTALRDRLHPVVAQEECPLLDADGRILSGDVTAPRSNPPGANSAVDGYGFAAAHTGPGDQILPLVEGRAAAGAPHRETVPAGQAIRILTGALLPEGVDTVVLEEDTTRSDHHIAFEGPVKPGANTRKAGEDVAAGDEILPRGTRLRAPELALLGAVGVARVPVFSRLRVGVLSTGDEIVEPGHTADPGKTYDANRAMLLAVARGWGYEAVDLGHAADDRDDLRRRLDDAAGRVDAILTSGGASAGDEDHMSAILRAEGQVQNWRIALKPGRPLALGQWQGIPVFGLPGNPVAALVCTLIFARPALSVMAGGSWTTPARFTVPAAFEKSKKPGRREYLRARLTATGSVEVFASEGSGRISGLSWADGLVELQDHAAEITHGTPVHFLPYADLMRG